MASTKDFASGGAHLLHLAEYRIEVVRLVLVQGADVLDVPQLLAVARQVLRTRRVLVRLQPLGVLRADVLRWRLVCLITCTDLVGQCDNCD